MNTEFYTPFEWFMQMHIIQNLDGRDLWHTYMYKKKKKSTFLQDYSTKSDGVFTEMQIISYIFIILN